MDPTRTAALARLQDLYWADWQLPSHLVQETRALVAAFLYMAMKVYLSNAARGIRRSLLG